GKRIYAAVKFFIYTFLGSMFLLVGLVAMSYFYHEATGEDHRPHIVLVMNFTPPTAERPAPRLTTFASR
uniref:proton-conducting transporter transmembrane domain-containing protein n=1 Tax=uncultured Fretibacterium sp. TaxID=1678694 RepID=UPI002611AF30